MTCSTFKSLFGCTALAVAALGFTNSAFGQGCGGQITPDPLPINTTFAVGQSLAIEVEFGPTGNGATINSLVVNLECKDASGCFTTCDPGTALTYLGDATIGGNTCGVAITSNNAGGGSTGSVTFTFTPGVVLAAGATCKFQFGVTINSLSDDTTPKQITGTAQYFGSCNNGLPLSQCGSYGINVVDPDIQIVKSVSDDEVCEGEPVTYTYVVTNTGNADLENVEVVDDNGTPGNTADDFNPTFVGPDIGNDGILSPGEVWTYTHGPVVLPVGTTTNTAEVTGDFVNAVGTVTVDDEDDATVVVNPPPSCAIEDTPGECEVELCVTTNACTPFTVVWNGPGGFTSTSTCITLTASNLAGAYCVTVTDCNGCTSGGPGSSCCYNFVPPVAPSCTISVTDCPFPRTLTANVSNCSGCTFQWGMGTAGSCTPLPGETNSTFVANSPGTFCVTITSDDGCVSSCDLVVEECATGGQGRTPGFWKQEHHWGHWPAPYCAHDDCPCGPATLFCDVFDCTSSGDCQDAVDAAYEGKTLLEVLGQGGGGFYALGRHAVAALLNSAHNDLEYAFTTAEVIAMTDAAIDNCNPGPTKNQFAENNELGGGSLGGQLYCENLVAGYGSTWPDFNNDGVIDGADMAYMLDNWGPYTGPADLHKNNKINNKDVVIMVFLLGQYGN